MVKVELNKSTISKVVKKADKINALSLELDELRFSIEDKVGVKLANKFGTRVAKINDLSMDIGDLLEL